MIWVGFLKKKCVQQFESTETRYDGFIRFFFSLWQKKLFKLTHLEIKYFSTHSFLRLKYPTIEVGIKRSK